MLTMTRCCMEGSGTAGSLAQIERVVDGCMLFMTRCCMEGPGTAGSLARIEQVVDGCMLFMTRCCMEGSGTAGSLARIERVVHDCMLTMTRCCIEGSGTAGVLAQTEQISDGCMLTMTRCCMEGSGTGMRRALPMAGWGTSPSPPISLDVSTMTTRLCSSSASVRAISRMTVVLPTPGLPRNRMLLATAYQGQSVSLQIHAVICRSGGGGSVMERYLHSFLLCGKFFGVQMTQLQRCMSRTPQAETCVSLFRARHVWQSMSGKRTGMRLSYNPCGACSKVFQICLQEKGTILDRNACSCESSAVHTQNGKSHAS